MRRMTMQGLTLALMTLVLAGCGSSREMQAAEACEAAAKERTPNKLLSVDRKALAKSAKAESDDILQLIAPITLDTGLQSQYTQTLNCRVQFSGSEAKVIALTFVF